MSVFQRILVPVDFSDCGLRAVEYGCHLARRSQARLHLLHVIPDPGLYAPGAAAPIVLPATYLNDLREAARQSLEKLPAPKMMDGVTLSREVVFGSPADTILRRASDYGDDLICLGTHGRGGLARFAMGSVAEKVVRHAKCPVLAVHAAGDATADIAIRKVMVAVDFSEFTQPILELAEAIAREETAQVELVHVVEENSPARSEIGMAYPVIREYLRELRQKAEDQLTAIDGSRDVTRRVLMGRPFHELTWYATENHVDLIVIGTHGRTGVAHWFLGSVAEMVVRKSPCAVLVVPRSRFKQPPPQVA